MSNAVSLAVLPIAKRFHEGLCLAAGNDFQRAGAALLDCVVAEPDHGQYVQEFLTNSSRQSRPEIDQASFNAESVGRAAAANNWREVLQRGPQVLSEQPGHVPTLLALAEACAASDYAESEACYWRAVVQAAAD